MCAKTLIEVNIDQLFPEKVFFTNENGVKLVQKVIYECKLVAPADTVVSVPVGTTQQPVIKVQQKSLPLIIVDGDTYKVKVT